MYETVQNASQSLEERSAKSALSSSSVSSKKKKIKPNSSASAASSRSVSPTYDRSLATTGTGRSFSQTTVASIEELEDYLRKNFPNSALYRSLSSHQKEDIGPGWKKNNTYQKPDGKSSSLMKGERESSNQSETRRSWEGNQNSLSLTTSIRFPTGESNQRSEAMERIRLVSNKATSTSSLASTSTTSQSFKELDQNSARISRPGGSNTTAWDPATDLATVSSSYTRSTLE